MRSCHVVRVLGPIDIWTPDGVREVGGRRARMLLGALVVSVGRTVSSDQLVEALWGDDPPACALNTLQSYVSRLRGMLGSDAVRLVDHAYVLDADVDTLDALRFEHLVRTAHGMDDPSEVRAMCHEALGLWRGAPFGDLADLDPFRLEALRLDELRVAAMESQLEAELALGRHDLVIGALEASVQENPYRERLWHLLIEALGHQGRRVEALRVCADLRALLASAGLEGGQALDELEERILQGADL